MADHSSPATGYPAAGYPQAHPSTNPNVFTSNAYPYAAAPPPQPAGYYNPHPRATFLRRLLAIIIAIAIIVGTIIFIVWLVLRPRLPDFQVDSVSLSNFNLSTSPSSTISGDWDFRFTARNPNHKIRLYYDPIEASLFYKDQQITETTLPPFVQGRKNQTTVRAAFAAAAAYVDRWVVDEMNGDIRRGERVDFNVRMEALVRFKAGFWRARKRVLRVFCGGLPVATSSAANNGTANNLLGGPRDCSVGL